MSAMERSKSILRNRKHQTFCIEPSKVSYREVQRNQINTTIYNEKGNIKDIDTSIIRDMYDKSKPTLKQGAYISAIAASLEGGYCIYNSNN